jgi:hypothetical protein
MLDGVVCHQHSFALILRKDGRDGWRNDDGGGDTEIVY